MNKDKEEGIKLNLDGYLNENMDVILQEAIPNNWDCLGIVFGREGSGKSTLATQICYKLDPQFSVNNIVFKGEEFLNAIETLPYESAILWDEAITGAKASQYAEKIAQQIITNLTMIRKKRLKIILCLPYLYMINKYFVSRCLFSIYVYANGFTERGKAMFFNNTKTENIYNLMKEKFRYTPNMVLNRRNADFIFRFSKLFCADKKLYEHKKDLARQITQHNDLYRDRFLISTDYILEETNGTMRGLAKKLKICPQTLSDIRSRR